MLGLSGLLGGVGTLLGDVNDTVGGLAESVSPGATNGYTTTGNLIGDNGLTDDLFSNLAEGDLTGAVADAYLDIIGPGGVVNNLADGHGLGVEGLLGTVLGTVDGVTGGLLGGEGDLLGGLTDGLLGGDGDLLGGLTGGLLGTDGGLLDLDGGLLGGLLG
ncbi:hypothetical protein FHS76_003824 [Ochrobactrum daejeonense]|uniref:Uncharacterized protein n=1 Tax=Brucella daejeonensis TaxID=659015 RepID=A0A7W9B139_9HYPH|nr:hypothetical protein [Brucella daejeonensis]MBB5703909.1 hypothetical protein [Brucella daejeonensis]